MGDEDGSARLSQPVRRRVVIRTALAGMGGLAVSGFLPPWSGVALAGPSDPKAGGVVSPNPIPSVIEKSGVAVELKAFSTPPRTSKTAPYAHLNFLYHAGDGSGLVYAVDGRGRIWRIDRAGKAGLFLDVKAARNGALKFLLTNNRATTGLRSVAFHPNYAIKGKPGFGKLYTATTESPGSYSNTSKVPLFTDPAYPVKLHCVIAEWTVSAKNPAQVDPKSRREILRSAVYLDDHNLDQLMFDPNLKPGTPGYGMMFFGMGDGGNVTKSPDPYNQAQNLGRLLGKILRIDPLKQKNGKPYGIPADNPFVGQPGKLGEIWASGLRHPLNLSFDTGGTGAMLIADIGQKNVEEINLGVKGGNYGWPNREGTFVTDRKDGKTLYAPPANDNADGYLFPVAQFDHYVDGLLDNAAITGGFVYRGTKVPALLGHYLFGEFVQGRVFHVPVAELQLGSQATIKELTFKRDGVEVTLLELAASPERADLRFGQDQDGEVYIMTKHDGVIRTMSPA